VSWTNTWKASQLKTSIKNFLPEKRKPRKNCKLRSNWMSDFQIYNEGVLKNSVGLTNSKNHKAKKSHTLQANIIRNIIKQKFQAWKHGEKWLLLMIKGKFWRGSHSWKAQTWSKSIFSEKSNQINFKRWNLEFFFK